MVFYDATHEGWGEPLVWHKNAGYNDLAESQKHYLKCKMPIREFIYDITKDKSLSYQMGKNVSAFRLKWKKVSEGESAIKKTNLNLKNLAITGDGDVITRKNFNDYDWTPYIANL